MSLTSIFDDDHKEAETESIDKLYNVSKEDDLQNPYTITEKDILRNIERGKRGRCITQFYAGLCASIGNCSLGMVTGWSSPLTYQSLIENENYTRIILERTLELFSCFRNSTYISENCSFLNETTTTTNIDLDDYSWIISLSALGYALGIIPIFFLTEYFGPRLYMILSNLALIMVWIFMMIMSHWNMYKIGRFLSGFFASSFYFGGLMMIRDCTTKYYTRIMLVLFRSSFLFGLVITYTMSSFWGKMTSCIISTSICAIHVTFLYFGKDSPVNLYKKNPIEGEKALAWYWGSANIHSQLQKIKKYHEERKREDTSELHKKFLWHSKVVFKGLLTVFLLMFFETFTGYYPLLYYNVSLFRDFQGRQSTEVMEERVNVSSVCFGVLLWIIAAVSQYVHYPVKFGVKKPLLVSAISITAVLALITIYVKIFGDGNSSPVTTVVLFTLFVLAYHLGLNTYSGVILKDVMPIQIYSIARYVLEFLQAIMIFISVRYFVIAVRDYSYFITYGMMTIISLISVFYIRKIVMETKGKSLVEIQLELGGNPVGTRIFV